MIVKCDKRELLFPTQFYLEQELSVADVKEVISVSVTARTLSTEALSGEARANYRVFYRVLYKDNADGIACYEQSFDHQYTVKAPSLAAGGFASLNVCVVSNEYVGSERIKLRSMLEFKGYFIESCSFDIAEAGEGVCGKVSKTIIENIEAVKPAELVVAGSLDNKEQIEEILCYDTQILIKSVAMATEICQIEGECVLNIYYLSGGNLASKCEAVPFKSEILCANAKGDCEAFCDGLATSVSLNLDNDNGAGVIRLEAVVQIKGFIVQKNEVDIMTDAYSCTKELLLKTDTVYVESNVCLSGIYEKLSGSLRIGEGEARIRTVLCVCPPSVGAVSVVSGSTLSVEGVAAISVIYVDEEQKIREARTELPFRYVVAKDFTCKESLYANVKFACLNARLRYNDEIEINGDVYIEIFGSELRPLGIVASVEEAGDRQLDECAISLYIVKRGETLWDVAKALVTEEETLLRLNPEIKLPFEGGEKVLLYREL